MLKQDSIPFSAADVAALRGRLTESYAYEVLDRDDKRYLFLRAAHDDPDPVLDLEAGLQSVPSWVTQGLASVLLIGARSLLHVPAYSVLPVLQARDEFDQRLVQDARAHLEAAYGLRLAAAPGDLPATQRLFVRVPRERCLDLVEADLVELARRVGPLQDADELRCVHACHLVAEHDALRFRAADFLGDLAQRWTLLRPLKAPPAPPPRRVEDVRPLFELEEDLVALPADQALGLRLKQAETSLHHALRDAGFHVTSQLFLPDAPFHLLGERAPRYPHRVGVRMLSHVGRGEAEELLAQTRTHTLDLLVTVTPSITAEAQKRLVASKVKVLRPDEVAHLRL